MTDILFIIFSALTVLSAAYSAFSGNLVRSAFVLLLTLALTAGIYVLLGSDFLAVIQLLIYVGGILVLILFAIMLTSEISQKNETTNPSRKDFMAPLLIIPTLIFVIFMIFTGPNETSFPDQRPVTESIGELLLTDHILSFELVSFLLLIGLVGSVYIVRHSRARNHQNQDGAE
ncbi:MAG: NADH-quinone oxidoreductase subunit J [Spirochaetia bacterium]|nr:NADH-quinone oxidoreductase subunit J [Spirochaetia bacterium]